MPAAIPNVTDTVNTTTTKTNTNTKTTTSTDKSGTSAAQNSLNSDYDQFLKLLTTQLTNQDPTAPLDTNQITQQVAQLSQVQQSINTNTKLDELIAIYNSAQGSSAVSYIGKQVDATGNQIDLKKGGAALVYDLPKGASSATVTIKDSTGKTIFSGPGTTNAGRNQVLWQGVNTSGVKVPDGVYSFSVDAKDSKSKSVGVTTYTTGVVSAVETQNGVNSLLLGKISVPLNSVKSVYESGANPEA